MVRRLDVALDLGRFFEGRNNDRKIELVIGAGVHRRHDSTARPLCVFLDADRCRAAGGAIAGIEHTHDRDAVIRRPKIRLVVEDRA